MHCVIATTMGGIALCRGADGGCSTERAGSHCISCIALTGETLAYERDLESGVLRFLGRRHPTVLEDQPSLAGERTVAAPSVRNPPCVIDDMAGWATSSST